MRCLIFFVSCFLSTAYGQRPVKVADAETMLPLSFSSLNNPVKGSVSLADESGQGFTDFVAGDTVIVSHVGYESQVLTEYKSVVLLQKLKTLLPVVKLAPGQKSGSLILSDDENRISDTWEDNSVSYSAPEIAQGFLLPAGKSFYAIKNVRLPFKNLFCPGYVILRIYSGSANDSIPGNELFLSRIKLKGKKKNAGKTLIDLRSENIILRGGEKFFVSVTWEDKFGYDRCRSVINLQKTTVPNYVTRCKTCFSRDSPDSVRQNYYVWFAGTRYFDPSDPSATWYAQMFADAEVERFKSSDTLFFQKNRSATKSDEEKSTGKNVLPVDKALITGTWQFSSYISESPDTDIKKMTEESKDIQITFHSDHTFETVRITNGVSADLETGNYEISDDGRTISQGDTKLHVISLDKKKLVLTYDDIIQLAFERIK